MSYYVGSMTRYSSCDVKATVNYRWRGYFKVLVPNSQRTMEATSGEWRPPPLPLPCGAAHSGAARCQKQNGLDGPAWRAYDFKLVSVAFGARRPLTACSKP
eukprot:2523598-Pleurochrysis_carterae.AAC.1